MKNQYRMLFSRYTINMWYSGAALLSPVTDDPFTSRWAEGQILPSPVGESPGGGAEPGCGAALQGNVPTWAGTTADISRESFPLSLHFTESTKTPQSFPRSPNYCRSESPGCKPGQKWDWSQRLCKDSLIAGTSSLATNYILLIFLIFSLSLVLIANREQRLYSATFPGLARKIFKEINKLLFPRCTQPELSQVGASRVPERGVWGPRDPRHPAPRRGTCKL